jgi:hypothetical protein
MRNDEKIPSSLEKPSDKAGSTGSQQFVPIGPDLGVVLPDELHGSTCTASRHTLKDGGLHLVRGRRQITGAAETAPQLSSKMTSLGTRQAEEANRRELAIRTDCKGDETTIDGPTIWPSSYLKSPGTVFVCAIVLIAIIGIAHLTTPAPTSKSSAAYPVEICNALRSYGVTEVRWQADPRGGRRYSCRTPPHGNGAIKGHRLSIAVHSSPKDPGILESVEIEGHYPTRGFGNEVKREMRWAASSVFTRLGLEVPLEVADGIDQASDCEFKAGNLHVHINHSCEDPQTGSTGYCRVALFIQNAV